jgi:hypothetical protein
MPCPIFHPEFSVHLRVPTQLFDFLIDSTVLNRTHETETPYCGTRNYLCTDTLFRHDESSSTVALRLYIHTPIGLFFASLTGVLSSNPAAFTCLGRQFESRRSHLP